MHITPRCARNCPLHRSRPRPTYPLKRGKVCKHKTTNGNGALFLRVGVPGTVPGGYPENPGMINGGEHRGCANTLRPAAAHQSSPSSSQSECFSEAGQERASRSCRRRWISYRITRGGCTREVVVTRVPHHEHPPKEHGSAGLTAWEWGTFECMTHVCAIL